MFFVVSKILAFAIQPVVWVISLLIFSFLSRNSKNKRRLLISSILVLFVFSNTFIFNCISYAWETEPINPTELKDTFDIAVILGGIASYDESTNQTQFFSNSDRILNILPLYHDGRVKKILLTGGSG